MNEKVTEAYNPLIVEPEIYEAWEREGVFRSKPDSRPPYCIVIPPPNVTGALHMGHALNNSIQDVIIRYQRMKGLNVLWLPGTDHAGVATQSVVEKKLWEEQKLTRYEVGRKKLLELIWEWKEKYGNRIIDQLKSLGCSCDWERTRFTMDPGLSRAVRVVFITLYHEGLIYRGKRLINWCTKHRTALSNDELIYEEEKGYFWYIRYPLSSNLEKSIVVATTRPETMLGDTAVAVHPSDERYQDFIGKTVILPLTGRHIPVIADSILADPERGTGAVKVTPAHDPNDYECGKRNNLPMINIFNEDGTLNEAAGRYRGLSIAQARKKIVEDLEKEGYLIKVEEHNYDSPRCYRCGTVIEPFLSDQWFVKMEPLVKIAREAALNKEVVFHPETRLKQFIDWLDSTPDWCISRQIWWGHRIPVWYCTQCTKSISVDESMDVLKIPPEAIPIVPSIDEPMSNPQNCPICGRKDLVQDPDVLDTWFSSQLWPISTLGWPDKTDDLKYYYPTDVLVTARDIIALWVARMVMMGKKFMGLVPFRHVFVHGTILDEKGDIMSKSRGNGIDPLMLIRGGSDEVGGRVEHYKTYGADALRYGILSMATAGQDIRLVVRRKQAGDYFDVEVPKIEEGRRFCNKIWQVTRGVVLAQCEDMFSHAKNFEKIEDKWLQYKLSTTIETVTRQLENFEIGEACNLLYKTFWDDFCSWYVEIVKPRLWKQQDSSRLEAQTMLVEGLSILLKMLHPVMPFITEKLWKDIIKIRKNAGMQDFGERITTSRWPQPEQFPRDKEAYEICEDAVKIAGEINSIKSHNITIKEKKLPVVYLEGDEEIFQSLSTMFPGLKRFTGVENFEPLSNIQVDSIQGSAVGIGGRFKIYIPLKGLVDFDLEKNRVMKKIGQTREKLESVLKKLQNPDFLTHAKPEIIEREKERERELLEEIKSLEESLEWLGKIT